MAEVNIGYVIDGKDPEGRRVRIDVIHDKGRGTIYRSIYTDEMGRIAVGLCFEPHWMRRALIDAVTCVAGALLAIVLFSAFGGAA